MMFVCTLLSFSSKSSYKDVLLNMLSDVWWDRDCISGSRRTIYDKCYCYGVSAHCEMNRLRAFSPHCEMFGFGENVLLRTVDAYHRRLESPPPLNTVLIDTRSIFPC